MPQPEDGALALLLFLYVFSPSLAASKTGQFWFAGSVPTQCAGLN